MGGKAPRGNAPHLSHERAQPCGKRYVANRSHAGVFFAADTTRYGKPCLLGSVRPYDGREVQ